MCDLKQNVWTEIMTTEITLQLLTEVKVGLSVSITSVIIMRRLFEFATLFMFQAGALSEMGCEEETAGKRTGNWTSSI